MTFRRDKKQFYEGLVLLLLFTVLSVLFIFIFGWELSGFAAVWAVLLVGYPRCFQQYITIDERGISCREKDRQLWAFEWHQIIDLKKYSRYRNPGIALVLTEEAERQRQDATATSFQLCKEARVALDRYYGEQWRKK